MLAPVLLFVAYMDVTVEGWSVKVDRDWTLREAMQWGKVRRELENQLYRVTRVVPEPALTKLRQVTIWVHPTSPETKCMAYHPGAQWLRDHRMNPAMERGIEIGNAANFLSWTHEQPWMVLHELAHAYHHRFLPKGFDNSDLAGAHVAARESKRYDAVLHINGKTDRHYALSNPMEYFAEASEAYFGQNDFFPFVRSELKSHDPAGYALVERLWRQGE